VFALRPDEPVVMVQSADPDRYAEMLHITSGPNRDFCRRHGVRYGSTLAVIRGFHPWQACFNRIVLLHGLVALGYRGWYLHLDADAYVHDRGFDVASYLRDHAAHSLIAAPGATAERWDVNDGVFFANLGHPHAREIVHLWMRGLEALTPDMLRGAPDWGTLPEDDQSLLQGILRSRPDLAATLHREAASLINSPTARFTRQVLRSQERDLAVRVRRIARDVGRSMEAAGEVAGEVTGEAAGDRGGSFGLLLPALALALGVPVPGPEAQEAAAEGGAAVVPALEALLSAGRGRSRAGSGAARLLLPALARSLGVPPPDPSLVTGAANERDGILEALRALIAAYKVARRQDREAARAAREGPA